LKSTIVIGESSSRQGVFLSKVSLSLFDMLLATRGGSSRTWCSLRGSPKNLLRWFFCFLGRESFHFVPCFLSPSPLLFLGTLVYLWLARFHHDLVSFLLFSPLYCNEVKRGFQSILAPKKKGIVAQVWARARCEEPFVF